MLFIFITVFSAGSKKINQFNNLDETTSIFFLETTQHTDTRTINTPTFAGALLTLVL